MEETVEDLPNTTTTTPSSSSNSKETEKQEKKVIISDDILHDFLTFLTRVELGQNFSLVSRRFRAFAYPKMHVHNAHWVEGECHFLTSAAHTTMVVPRGDVGGFEQNRTAQAAGKAGA
uniref:F-box domain-containing protein n=1 Tax=Globodera pallida TaxID=36090 RepID=A0A183C6I4_GLOPA